MTLFVAIAAGFVALALAFVLPPLLRKPKPPDDRDATNAAILREQLAELRAEHAPGSPEYERAHAELERRALAEAPREASTEASKRPLGAAIAVALLVPLVAVLGYWQVGTPEALQPMAMLDPEKPPTRAHLESLVERLWERMHKFPNDPEGWALLGRSLGALGEHQRAAQAYARALELQPRDADLLADLAEAIGNSRNRKLEGEPYALLKRALALDPEHLKALALAGSAAFELGEYDNAITHWSRILSVVPAESEIGRALNESLAEARKRAASAPAVAAGPSLQGVVKLDPKLAASVAPGDTVFVVARAANGPRMPLAVARTTVAALPYRFKLDDSMAMAGGSKLSAQKQVIVAARVSRSGEALPKKGDLEGASAPVRPGASGIEIVLDRVVQ